MTDADTEAREIIREAEVTMQWPLYTNQIPPLVRAIAAALRARETQTVEAILAKVEAWSCGCCPECERSACEHLLNTLRALAPLTPTPADAAPLPVAWKDRNQVSVNVPMPWPEKPPLTPGGERTPTSSAAGLTYPTCPTCCSHDHSTPAAAPREDA